VILIALEEADMKKMCGLLALLVIGVASTAAAQTKGTRASSVGTWKVDVQQSDFGSDPKPKSMTLTVLEDTPQHLSWRLDTVDGDGKPSSESWSGPLDGTMLSAKGPDGAEIYKASFKWDGDVLQRHIEGALGPLDGRTTMSTDGNTMTDVAIIKQPDGKTAKWMVLYHRDSAAQQK
jgi:hypothetical protein